MKRVAIIFGTRPEAIKLIPVYFLMQKSENFHPVLISTGQHREMLNQIFDFFKVQPDLNLSLMVENQTLANLSSVLMNSIGRVYQEIRPDLVMVQGDTTTAMIASLVAFYENIPIAHVEAGLRTYNRNSPFPEEVNRRIISVMADVHFAPTERAAKALRDEKITNLHVVGNTVVDSLKLALGINASNTDTLLKRFEYLNPHRRLVLITSHRRESFGEPFMNIIQAILELSKCYKDTDFVYPVHLNPNVKVPVYDHLNARKNIFLIDPLPYGDMVYLLSRAHIILTDSGGIQEEAPTLNVPLIVMRETTERQEVIENGCAVLSGTSKEKIIEEFVKIFNDDQKREKMANALNPYGDGRASNQIIDILDQW